MSTFKEFKHGIDEIRKSLNCLVKHYDLQIIERKCIMSAISDWYAQEQANLTNIQNELTVIQTGITNLDNLIQTLQNSPGTLSQSDQNLLDQVQQASAALVQQASNINLAPPVPTPPSGPAISPGAATLPVVTMTPNTQINNPATPVNPITTGNPPVAVNPSNVPLPPTP